MDSMMCPMRPSFNPSGKINNMLAFNHTTLDPGVYVSIASVNKDEHRLLPLIPPKLATFRAQSVEYLAITTYLGQVCLKTPTSASHFFGKR